MRERRAFVRYSIEAQASIVLVKGGSVLRGDILDLSLGGCRIHCKERFPVGIYTRVETEFYVAGLSFRLAGVIQAIHGSNDVGIRFLDMSSRKRDQIEQLLHEIEEMLPKPPASDLAMEESSCVLDSRRCRSASPRPFALQFSIDIALRLSELARQALQCFLLIHPGFSLNLRNPVGNLLGRACLSA